MSWRAGRKFNSIPNITGPKLRLSKKKSIRNQNQLKTSEETQRSNQAPEIGEAQKQLKHKSQIEIIEEIVNCDLKISKFESERKKSPHARRAGLLAERIHDQRAKKETLLRSLESRFFIIVYESQSLKGAIDYEKRFYEIKQNTESQQA
ncbi:MAG: hypothetical protein ACQEUZ_05035 [Pseudomonadota bacterium]